MKSKFSLFVAALFLCFTMMTTVASAADVKIGVIDVQKIINGCKAGPGAQASFQKKVEAFQKGIKADRDALIKLKQEIDKKKSVWNEAKTKEKIVEYQKAGRALQVKEAGAQQSVQRIQAKELEPILKALEPVVEKYAKKNNYTVILEAKAGVVYYQEDTLVTDIIIKELDKAMAK